jgi:hypothetical protein
MRKGTTAIPRVEWQHFFENAIVQFTNYTQRGLHGKTGNGCRNR